MRVAYSREISLIDKYCIEELKLPGIILMENAAIKVANAVEAGIENIVIVAGTGNNGGDGLAAARHLYKKGISIKVFLIGKPEKMSDNCAFNYGILKNIGFDIINVNNSNDLYILMEHIKTSELIIDGIFGTGLNRKVEGIFYKVIELMNGSEKNILAIDVPSGMNSDTGEIMNICVRANKTISFEMQKMGFFRYGSSEYIGEIVVEPIGIPEFVVDKFFGFNFYVDKKMIKENITPRNKYGHKGNYGRVLLLAGSRGYSGAAYICCEAAVKTGSGLVTLGTPKELQPILSEKLIEAMTICLEDEEKIEEAITKSDIVAIGPGLGNNERTLKLLKKVIEKANCSIVIDADGINVLKDNLYLVKHSERKIILTPHLGEMSKITGMTVEKIEEDRIGVAKSFAEEYGVIVLLKGYNTVVTDGKEVYINSTGNSAMASGGMGDCLTGIIASFIGQGYPAIKAAYISAYIHGYCGERVSQKKFTVTASDILNEVPYAIKEILK